MNSDYYTFVEDPTRDLSDNTSPIKNTQSTNPPSKTFILPNLRRHLFFNLFELDLTVIKPKVFRLI